MRLYRLAAKQGDAGAMFSLATDLEDGSGCEYLKDAVLAVQWMRRAAELGFADAQGQLGAWYMQEKGARCP